MKIRELMTEQDVDELLASSAEEPVMVFKHSTRCPLSAAAHREFEAFARDAEGVILARVRVIEERPISNRIAAATGVTHQSPQAILLRGGKAVWNASHQAITHAALKESLL